MTTPIESASKVSREGPAGRAIPEPPDYHELRVSLSFEELIGRARRAETNPDAAVHAAHAYHWYRAAKDRSKPDSPERRAANEAELAMLHRHLYGHAFTAAELVERFGHEHETPEEALVRVAVEVINELHSPMFSTYEENRSRCIVRLRALREYVEALDRSLKARRAATTTKEAKADKPIELTAQQAAVLQELRGLRKPIGYKELGKRLGKTENAARAQANRMAELGFAERHKTPQGLKYKITAQGVERLERDEGVVELDSRR
jgi:DNA-binding MarR family transcriptional regulator